MGIKDRYLYVLAVDRGHWGINEGTAKIAQLARAWTVDLVLVENTSSGVSMIPLLTEHTNLNVLGQNPAAKKEVRMGRHQGLIEAGKLLLPLEAPWLAEFEKELLSFPSGRHDDQVDAVLQLLEWYTENESHLQPIGNIVIELLYANERFLSESSQREAYWRVPNLTLGSGY
jgi:predicted phage terminase large subunit-like protein